jgi:hypothetical protein
MAAVFLTLCFCSLLPLGQSVQESPQPYLVFSTWFTVSRMNLDGSDYSVLVDSSDNSGPRSVDYHWRLNLLFWSHYRDGTINQADLDGSNPA